MVLTDSWRITWAGRYDVQPPLVKTMYGQSLVLTQMPTRRREANVGSGTVSMSAIMAHATRRLTPEWFGSVLAAEISVVRCTSIGVGMVGLNLRCKLGLNRNCECRR